MGTGELAPPLASCGIAWASWSRAGEFVLVVVVWVQEGWWPDQLIYISVHIQGFESTLTSTPLLNCWSA